MQDFLGALCQKKRDHNDYDNDDDDDDNDDDNVQKCGVVPAGLLGCWVFA